MGWISLSLSAEPESTYESWAVDRKSLPLSVCSALVESERWLRSSVERLRRARFISTIFYVSNLQMRNQKGNSASESQDLFRPSRYLLRIGIHQKSLLFSLE